MAISKTLVDGIGEVTISRRKKLKYLRISITPDNTVRLSIPWYIPKSAGIKYLISKKDWISKHRLPEPEGYKDGQMITEDTVLRIIETDKKRASYSIQPGSYIIYIPSAYKEAKRKSVIEKYIKSLLKRECENRLVPLLERMAKNEKIRIKEIRVKSMKSRWGSCNHENVITLNSALVLVPVELAEYVLCHELAHTRHLNHGEKFWREVEKMLPDYKIRRKRMRKYNSAKII